MNDRLLELCRQARVEEDNVQLWELIKQINELDREEDSTRQTKLNETQSPFGDETDLRNCA